MLHNRNFPQRRQRSIRALIVIPGLGAGGAERCFVSLVKHFEAVDVAAIIVRNGSGASPDLVAEAERYTRVIMPDADEFVTAVEAESIGVHVVLTWGLSDLADIMRRVDRPVIDACHTSAEWESLKPVMAGSSEGANYLVAVSEAARQSYPEKYQPQVTIIHNGIEASRASPRLGRSAVRRSWGIQESTPVALYCGRFSPEKRPMSLIDAMPDDFLLVAAGPMSDHKREFEQAATRRMPGRTAFVQFSTHVGDLMAMADCLVMPSQTEAHPLTMLEAFYAKLPVVCCEFEFIHERIEDGDPPLFWRDLLWTVGIDFDSVTLESVMRKAVAERMSQRVLKAHDLVVDRFLADQMAARWETFIFKALKEWFSYSVNPPLIFNGERK